MRNVLIAVVVLIVGVAGLFLPISAFDGDHSTVGCGNALVTDESGPRAANVSPVAGSPAGDQVVPQPDFVAACTEAISARRHWATPLVIVGFVGMIVGVVLRGRRGV